MGERRPRQQPVLELRPASVSFHGMNARVSDTLRKTERKTVSHKYGIGVFGALCQ